MQLRRTVTLLAATTALAACTAVQSTVAKTAGRSYTTALVGAQEVPGPGDPDGTGTAKVIADATTNQICVDMTVRAISTPTAAHIHSGAKGDFGPPVVTLPAPVGGEAKECQGVDKSLAAAILANPANYYVNVHTADYPNGAIRGQLE